MLIKINSIACRDEECETEHKRKLINKILGVKSIIKILKQERTSVITFEVGELLIKILELIKIDKSFE